jgi:hypothetical protein
VKGGDHLEGMGVGVGGGVDGKIILKWIFKKKYVRLWIGLVCLSIGTSGALLSTFGFHKLQGMS